MQGIAVHCPVPEVVAQDEFCGQRGYSEHTLKRPLFGTLENPPKT